VFILGWDLGLESDSQIEINRGPIVRLTAITSCLSVIRGWSRSVLRSWVLITNFSLQRSDYRRQGAHCGRQKMAPFAAELARPASALHRCRHL